MKITKDQLARDVAERSGFYLKDIKAVLCVMDDLVKEYFSKVNDGDDVSVQLVEGIKIGCSVVPQRSRKNPKTGEDIVCLETVKPNAKFSSVFRDLIQKQYEET